jgi:hypothetical protein
VTFVKHLLVLQLLWRLPLIVHGQQFLVGGIGKGCRRDRWSTMGQRWQVRQTLAQIRGQRRARRSRSYSSSSQRLKVHLLMQLQLLLLLLLLLCILVSHQLLQVSLHASGIGGFGIAAFDVSPRSSMHEGTLLVMIRGVIVARPCGCSLSCRRPRAPHARVGVGVRRPALRLAGRVLVLVLRARAAARARLPVRTRADLSQRSAGRSESGGRSHGRVKAVRQASCEKRHQLLLLLLLLLLLQLLLPHFLHLEVDLLEHGGLIGCG